MAIDLFAVDLVPVVAPGFLNFPISPSITPEQMRGYVQCLIRDTARRPASRGYYLIGGARNWTVRDQPMKRELILQGMGWGHMPRYLIEQDLRDQRLLPITGRYFNGGRISSLPAAEIFHTVRSPIACGALSSNKRHCLMISDSLPKMASAIAEVAA